MTPLLSNAVAPNTAFSGINSEILVFILFILVIIFTSNALWGTVQKYIEKRKSKQEGNLDERKLDFEIDKFGVETVQKAILTLNDDMNRIRTELKETKDEVGKLKINNDTLSARNAAMFRYIAKAISKRRLDGIPIVPVDEVDHFIIPDVVNITK